MLAWKIPLHTNSKESGGVLSSAHNKYLTNPEHGKIMSNKTFYSTKTYEHSVGLSACFRQWPAKHSHCQYLHGYALQVKIVFKADTLDERNWVVDFGDLKDVKRWLADTFDHKTLVAADDPQISLFREMHIAKLIDLVIVPAVGCERFAELVYDHVTEWLERYNEKVGRGLGFNAKLPIELDHVEIREHGGNSAICQTRK